MMESVSVAFRQAKFLSVSLHPWYLSAENLQAQINWMEHCLSSDPRVVAVGEAGLDKLCDTPLPLQQEAFQAAIELSEKYRFPLLIHAVKATAELLALQKKYRPTQPWIIHGFRGKKNWLKIGSGMGFISLWREIPGKSLVCRTSRKIITGKR